MKSPGTILLIDDDEEILFSLKFLLKQHYQSVFTESNPYHVPRLLRQHAPDVVMLDMNFRRGQDDGAEGLHWLTKVKELSPETGVILMTAYSDVNLAVEALKAGASDFIEKPWRNEKLLATVNSVYELSNSRRKLNTLTQKQRMLADTHSERMGEMIGESVVMQDVFRTIDKVAPTHADVLVLGENGTGKELVASRIHALSERAGAVFIPVDLGAIPDTLFESEVFGHVKGAFTGAETDRMGRLVAADGGTLFLDEIGNLSLPAQAKLLQVLQRREVIPVGGNKPVKVDLRLICATNKPLHQMVAEGLFREDLLYRINTVEINLPPLRHRNGDIALLAMQFLQQFSDKYEKPGLRFNRDALAALESYYWPGNIRELKHVIERCVILVENSIITTSDLALKSGSDNMATDQDTEAITLEQMERNMVKQALDRHKGNISKAAKELGITRAALYRRLEKFDL